MRSADANVDPFALFSDWLLAARRSGSLSNPAAFCLSTLNERGQPDARMLDLKEFSSAGFVFGTHLDSPKARAISANASVALTFWWDHIGRQVRVLGQAEPLDQREANAWFEKRSRDAQLTSWASRQSDTLRDHEEFETRLLVARQRFDGKPISRPDRWGGYRVIPSRMEFLTFRADRRHERLVFERRAGGEWRRRRLEP